MPLAIIASTASDEDANGGRNPNQMQEGVGIAFAIGLGAACLGAVVGAMISTDDWKEAPLSALHPRFTLGVARGASTRVGIAFSLPAVGAAR